MKHFGHSLRILFLGQCVALLPTALQGQIRTQAYEAADSTTPSAALSVGITADSIDLEPKVLQLSESRNQRSRAQSQLIGAVIGGVGGALLSLVMANSATGDTGVHPLFVLGGALVGVGIGSAVGDDDSAARKR